MRNDITYKALATWGHLLIAHPREAPGTEQRWLEGRPKEMLSQFGLGPQLPRLLSLRCTDVLPCDPVPSMKGKACTYVQQYDGAGK